MEVLEDLVAWLSELLPDFGWRLPADGKARLYAESGIAPIVPARDP
jgi:hypothetical protein